MLAITWPTCLLWWPIRGHGGGAISIKWVKEELSSDAAPAKKLLHHVCTGGWVISFFHSKLAKHIFPETLEREALFFISASVGKESHFPHWCDPICYNVLASSIGWLLERKLNLWDWVNMMLLELSVWKPDGEEFGFWLRQTSLYSRPNLSLTKIIKAA